MSLVKEPEMMEKKVAAIRNMRRHKCQREALEETVACQDVPETKGIIDELRKPYKNL
jgi:hypothetical protein